MNDYTKLVRQLRTEAGCTSRRQGRRDHEIWWSPITGRSVTVDGAIESRHTANATLKHAGLPNAF
ncbi:type II toxin-antitoxin system HicA family toxin [Salinarimonas chemoclinalis]|uniref:type II toxin-antitoxin system HicA family toxin n=1 Tax=Salinarimonas chemoclinalis TaxID=3241599 RepID=UPI003557EF22